MNADDGGSVEEWAERAIVENSLAAAQEESLSEVGNPTAKRVARRRAEEASADLARALDALREKRRLARG